jgi:phage terminase small subunit
MAGKITRAQKRFIDFYIEQDFRNAAFAYRKAYPNASEESARREASRLLTKPDIQKHMNDVIVGILKQEKIPLEKRIFDTWARMAFYDPAEIVDGKGALIHPLEELSKRGLSVCVEGIETRMNAQGETVKVKLADRNKALEMLKQYIQMIKPQMQRMDITGNMKIAPETLEALNAIFHENKNPGDKTSE